MLILLSIKHQLPSRVLEKASTYWEMPWISALEAKCGHQSLQNLRRMAQ